MLDPIEFGKAMAVIVREATAPLLKRIEQLEALAPVKGDKGDQGARGIDAEPIDIHDVVAEVLAGAEIKTLVDLHVAESVQKHFEANPIRHGKDGIDGKPGERGPQGDRGDRGKAGEDGTGLAGAMIDREGCLTITTTKGTAINLGKVVGSDGKNGADLTDVTFDYDCERGLVIRNRDGVEIVKRLPIPMNKGYWREGMACEKGDIVTQLGDAWIAIRDTKAKPCRENKEDWQLFARKGRDGIDGKSGRDLGPPPPIKLDRNHA